MPSVIDQKLKVGPMCLELTRGYSNPQLKFVPSATWGLFPRSQGHVRIFLEKRPEPKIFLSLAQKLKVLSVLPEALGLIITTWLIITVWNSSFRVV